MDHEGKEQDGGGRVPKDQVVRKKYEFRYPKLRVEDRALLDKIAKERKGRKKRGKTNLRDAPSTGRPKDTYWNGIEWASTPDWEYVYDCPKCKGVTYTKRAQETCSCRGKLSRRIKV